MAEVLLFGKLGKTLRRLMQWINDVAPLADRARRIRDGYVAGNIACGLGVDANANDVETTTAISILYLGDEYPIAAQAAIDLSTKSVNAATIATSKAGACWIFAKYDGTIDAETHADAEATQTTAIGGLAEYARATNTMPPAAGYVPIGVVSLVEGGSGTFTWGTDSITAETEVYYSFRGAPGIVAAAASFAATGGGAATFAYGAGVIRLGTGATVAYTGKTGVTFSTLGATDVASGKTGVFLLYVLADDVEHLVQLGGAGYASEAEAKAAFVNHNRNPLMPCVGVIYVRNRSGAAFVPATTALDASGITCTFVAQSPAWPTAAIDSFRDVRGAP